MTISFDLFKFMIILLACDHVLRLVSLVMNWHSISVVYSWICNDS